MADCSPPSDPPLPVPNAEALAVLVPGPGRQVFSAADVKTAAPNFSASAEKIVGRRITAYTWDPDPNSPTFGGCNAIVVDPSGGATNTGFAAVPLGNIVPVFPPTNLDPAPSPPPAAARSVEMAHQETQSKRK